MFDLPLTILQCWFDKTFFNLETLFQGTCEEYSSNLWSHLIRGVKPCKIYCEMFQKQTKKIAPQAKKAKKNICAFGSNVFLEESTCGTFRPLSHKNCLYVVLVKNDNTDILDLKITKCSTK